MPLPQTRLDPEGYYARLGVMPSASSDEIAAAFRRKARALHPDVPITGNTDAFVAARQAHDILTNPQLRAAYDRAARRALLDSQEVGEIPPDPPPIMAAVPTRHPHLSDLPIGIWAAAAIMISFGVLEAVLHLTGVVGQPAAPARRDPPAVVAARPAALPDAATADPTSGNPPVSHWTTADSETAGNPGTAGNPARPGNPGTTATPGTIGSRGATGNSGTTGNPGTPGNPGQSGTQGPWGNLGAADSLPSGMQVAPMQLAGTPNFYVIPAAGTTVLWRHDTLRNAFVPTGQIPPFSAVQALRLDGRTGLMEIQVTDSTTGLVEASRLSPGDTAAARRAYCGYNAGVFPNNGEVLERRGRGNETLQVTNRGAQPAVMKLRDATGAVAVSVFLAPGGRAAVTGLQAGIYQPDFAIGEMWSRACNGFAAGMRAQRFIHPTALAALSPLAIPPDASDGLVEDISDRSFESD
jgi:hypothetical protein